MQFPVYFHLFGLRIHPHPVMELIGYTAGFQLYRVLRRRDRHAAPLNNPELEIWLLGAALLGALLGSKMLAWVESWPAYWAHRAELTSWMGGKTIVGGLLGGWIGVEIAKRVLHIRRSTGDAVVFPLALGMAIGRVGCFLTGLDDHTCGGFTSVPWAVNFGDGPRHPAQLYDIVFLAAFAGVLFFLTRRPPTLSPLPVLRGRVREGAIGPEGIGTKNDLRRDEDPLPSPPPEYREREQKEERVRAGDLFLRFLFGYLLYRFAIEWLKPRWQAVGPLSPIQLACVIGAVMCLVTAWIRRHAPLDSSESPMEAAHV